MSLLEPNDDQQFNPPLPKKSRRKKFVLIFSFVIFILVIAVGILYYSYRVRSKTSRKDNSPELTEQISEGIEDRDEVAELTAEVGKIMLLPDETPILATVTDLEKVKEQDFFSKAQLGDKVLVYMEAKKAILYRPSAKLIVEVGRVNEQMTQGQVAGENISDELPTSTPQIPNVTLSVPLSPKPTAIATPTPSVDFSTEY